MENKGSTDKFLRAKERVSKIKGFYRHIGVFVLFNIPLVLFEDRMAAAIFGERVASNPKAMEWVDWHLFIWGAILVIHALLVFGRIPAWIKKWEDRQIAKYMKRNSYDQSER